MKKKKLITAVLASLVIIILFVILGVNYVISNIVHNIKQIGINEKIFLEKVFEVYLPEGVVIKNIAILRGIDRNLYAKIEIPRFELEQFDSTIGFSYEDVLNEENSIYEIYLNEPYLKWWKIHEGSVIRVIEGDEKYIRFIYTAKDIENIEIFMFKGNIHLDEQDSKLFR